VKLCEFHIGDAAAGAPRHGDAVARIAVRIGRVEIDLAGAAGRQDHDFGAEGDDAAFILVERVESDAAGLGAITLAN